MHKVGDKFQVVVARDGDEKVCAGDVVTLQRVVNSYGAEFITESGEGFIAEFEGADVGVGRIVRPVITEPEYKEIPFSEATHEQRMDVGNLIIDGGDGVSEIIKFDMAGYAYTLRGKTKIYTDTTLLTIMIPT